VARAGTGNANRLDADRDGIACERNKAPFDPEPAAR